MHLALETRKETRILYISGKKAVKILENKINVLPESPAL
jgi:hypothetical protein